MRILGEVDAFIAVAVVSARATIATARAAVHAFVVACRMKIALC